MIKIVIFLAAVTLVFAAKTPAKTKDPCLDYPSCKLISDQMFANYCSRSTLKNMCPTHCDPKCKSSMPEISVKVLDIDSLEEDDYDEEDYDQTPSLSTSSTTTKKRAKHSRKKGSRKKNKHPNKTSTTTTTLSTTVQSTTTEEIIEEESVEIEETSPVPQPKSSKLKTTTTKETTTVPTTTVKVLHTEEDDSATIKTVANLPNGYFKTIYVPLYEAGFVQRVIPTSNKPECDFSRAVVCKKDKCNHDEVWCPVTNDVPKEQLEILLNYTTDIYMFETQGRIDTNETVTNFLLQYLNDAGILVSHLYRTDTTNSSVINKFMFEPAIRTNYIRLTPIDYVESVALRFEVYSKGVLYKPDKDK